jgi:hypothetical protein
VATVNSVCFKRYAQFVVRSASSPFNPHFKSHPVANGYVEEAGRALIIFGFSIHVGQLLKTNIF